MSMVRAKLALVGCLSRLDNIEKASTPRTAAKTSIASHLQSARTVEDEKSSEYPPDSRGGDSSASVNRVIVNEQP